MVVLVSVVEKEVSPKIKVACDRKIKIWDMDEYERVEQPPLTGCSLKASRSANSSTDKTKRMSKPK
jgi:hypothetical protein